MTRFGSFVPQGLRREFASYEKPGKEFEAIRSVALECERLGTTPFGFTTILLPTLKPPPIHVLRAGPP